jgi:hypothetical protein
LAGAGFSFIKGDIDMGAITKLDAVNNMLLMAGESMVSDLEENSGLDTETAEFVLEQFIRDFQMRGLANNRYIQKYELTAAGQIALPSNTISAELISFHSNSDGYRLIGIAKGNVDKILWNATDQTDSWDATTEFKVELIVTFIWNDMDTPVQRGILSSAARQYQLITQGDGDADYYLEGMEALYVSKGKAADLDDRRRSIWTSGSPKLREALNRGSTSNDPNRFRWWNARVGGGD